MKIVLFSGNHPRHHYLIKKLYDNSLLRAVVYEEREKFIPSIPNKLNQKFIDLFSYHFKYSTKHLLCLSLYNDWL